MGAAGPVEVLIASPLVSYTGADKVEALGETLGELLNDLDARFPGIRFRMIDEQDAIRPHIRLYVETREVKSLSDPVGARETVHVICALSGG